jgi:hypothetical protein
MFPAPPPMSIALAERPGSSRGSSTRADLHPHFASELRVACNAGTRYALTRNDPVRKPSYLEVTMTVKGRSLLPGGAQMLVFLVIASLMTPGCKQSSSGQPANSPARGSSTTKPATEPVVKFDQTVTTFTHPHGPDVYNGDWGANCPTANQQDMIDVTMDITNKGTADLVFFSCDSAQKASKSYTLDQNSKVLRLRPEDCWLIQQSDFAVQLSPQGNDGHRLTLNSIEAKDIGQP